MLRPTKTSPKPQKRLPTIFTLSFLTKLIITPQKARKYISILIKLVLSATINPVTVVPMFAPIIIGVACISVITPAFTRPIAITVVAAEL